MSYRESVRECAQAHIDTNYPTDGVSEAYLRLVCALENPQIWPAILDSQKFYEACQAYRFAPMQDQALVNKRYDELRFLIRDQIHELLSEILYLTEGNK